MLYDMYEIDVWRFGLESLLWNHCLWSLTGVKNSRESAKKLYESDTPKLIDMWDMQGILLDILFWNRSAFLPKDTLLWLQKVIDDLLKKTAVLNHYSITEDAENTTYFHESAPIKAFLENSWAVREILEWSKLVTRVLSAHTHMYFEKNINGILHTTIPSVSENINGKRDGRVWILDTTTWELKLVNVLRGTQQNILQ